MGVGTGGAQGARAPPIILPSEIFLTQNALLSRKFAHKTFIFNKIFRLAALANLDTSKLEIYKFKCSNYFTSFILKVSVLVQNIQKVCSQLFNIQSPSLILKIIGYNFNTIPVPKGQEKEMSCMQSFSSKIGPEYHNSAHILPKFLRGRTTRPPPLLPYSTKA